MGLGRPGIEFGQGASVLGAALALGALLLSLFITPPSGAGAADRVAPAFQGVASCAGTTCHGRLEADGAVVRQDELKLWQEPSTPGGAHSRAFTVLNGTRAHQITATLGLGEPASAPACLGCHATPAGDPRGARFLTSDGVGCEACHGAAGGWIASHYSVGASHAANVSRGMVALDRPATRAALCLDCHFGSARNGQFVSHRMMAAGHPRIAFELDLFSTLQLHHNEDADYAARKGRSDSVRMWAVGQAMALGREMALFANPARGSEGAFPEFTFFDCHSCHRRIFDQADRVKTWEANPGRPIPAGMPPFNDENMILLAAAARVGAPGLAPRLDADSRAFHAAIARDRGAAVAAANRLGATANALAAALGNAPTGGDSAFAMVDVVAGPVLSPRFTDYEGSAQGVMAIDTLLNALVRQGRVTTGAAAGIRANINRAYAAVKDPNAYRPGDFRASLAEAVRAIRALR
ncbi:multiheme c-type cytochrome [Sphingomonas sp. AR_OL41]|uniref:multiheme c-type cytochrome n=1 Tax=Sphingomonas sp. AR_OL41 TaxID=3042729 RepID=UPI00248037A0|nr:multiheme c-type cytochrome [Sphingomonas sp. AR_OL41]MDH7971205.1 multiheme c-type cytochrome [Sphingomonas sp. AR_OL41]